MPARIINEADILTATGGNINLTGSITTAGSHDVTLNLTAETDLTLPATGQVLAGDSTANNILIGAGGGTVASIPLGNVGQVLAVTAAGEPPAFISIPSGLTTEYLQTTPESVWVITHNLGKFPSVAVVDSSGNFVEGDLDYNSPNKLTLTFSAPFAGTVYLN